MTVEEFIIKAPSVCGLRSCMNVARVMVCITNEGWIGICDEHINSIMLALFFEESTGQVVSLRTLASSREEMQP